MQEKNITLSIIIIHLGSDDLLINILSSLYKSDLNVTFETIIIDNFSNSHNINNICSEFINCKIINLPKRVGYSKASNFGIAQSSGNFLLWCNNDLIFQINSINYLYHFLLNNKDYAIASPCLLNDDYSLQPCYSLYNLNLFTLIFSLTGFDQSKSSGSFDIKVAPGACCMIRKSALDKIGGALNENYYMYCEEFDLSYRLLLKKFKIRYIGDSKVIHLGGKTTNKTAINYLIQSLKSKLTYLKVNKNKFQSFIFYLFLVFKFFFKSFFYFLTYIILLNQKEKYVTNKKIFLTLFKKNIFISKKLIIYYNE